MPQSQFLNMNCLAGLKTIPDKSVDSVITSPPYYQLRKYSGIPDYIWDTDKDCNHDFSVIRTQNPNGSGGQDSKMLSRKDKNNFQESVDYNDRATYSLFCSKCGAWKGQLGLEPTYQLYLNHLWQIFDECYRVLKDEGTLWVNLGDSYSTISGNMKGGMTCDQINPNVKNSAMKPAEYTKGGLPSKCLMLIPHRFAIGMVDGGGVDIA